MPKVLPAIGAMLFATVAVLPLSGQVPPPAGERRIAADVAPGAAKVAAALDPLFDDPALSETRALIVIHRGSIVAERYAPGYGRDTKLVSWSMAKSVTGVLIGMLVADGRLKLDAPAPVAAWAQPGDPRGRITLRQLLQMRSGLEHEEGLGAASSVPVWQGDTARMLFLDGAADMANFAERHPLDETPGKQFEYSTVTSMILADIAVRALTPSNDPAIRRATMTAFLKGRLFDPLNMTSATPEYDAAGTMIGGSLIHATARDWARFGEFLRNKGRVDGAQILPESWVRFMTTSSPREAAYGGHIWLNHRPTGGAGPVLFPALAPASVFGCLGHAGQYVIVSPEQQLTVVRLGKTDGEANEAVTAQLGRLVALF